MVCSIISDMEISMRLRARLREEIEALADTYAQVDFLVGDMSGVERTAQEIIGQIAGMHNSVKCHRVSAEHTGHINASAHDTAEVIVPEAQAARRNRWMMKRADVAIICVEDREILPKPEEIHRLRIIDISR